MRQCLQPSITPSVMTVSFRNLLAQLKRNHSPQNIADLFILNVS